MQIPQGHSVFESTKELRMRRMLYSLLLCGLVWGHLGLTSLAAEEKRRTNELSPAEITDGWVRLFDGETLFGWKANSNVNWRVTDGMIEGDTGDSGLLNTTLQFADYELLCDFWMVNGGNSGIFLQSEFKPKSPVTDCYELNICDTHPEYGTGSFVGLAQPSHAVQGDGAWHTYHVVVHGTQVVVKLDGKPILDFQNPNPKGRAFGHIGLQKNMGHVKFKNIFLKPLKTKTLFNGKDLAGWRVIPGSLSQFTVKDGTLHVENGRGYLESLETFDDFIVQAECRTNGKHLNSGIFFRAIPGTEKNPADGYECQIRNEWMGDDRTKPVDFGTGAIYRRIATRKVIPNDSEWFTMTLAARGSQISVWVNGTQTTDWIDTRAPHDNPRQGLRTAAGHLSLQGHDPTTNLDFRNLRIVKLPVVSPPAPTK